MAIKRTTSVPTRTRPTHPSPSPRFKPGVKPDARTARAREVADIILNRQPRQPRTGTQLTDLADAKAQRLLDGYNTEIVELSRQINDLTELKRQRMAAAVSVVKQLDLPDNKLLSSSWTMFETAGRVSERIVKERLLEQGVDKAVIERATERKVGEPYWQVRAYSGEGEGVGKGGRDGESE